jgi:hypothetical protein
MNNPLYHVNDQRQALGEIARALKPGGVAEFNYITSHYFDIAYPMQKLLRVVGANSFVRGRLSALMQQRYIHEILTLDDLRKMVNDAGLQVISETPFASVKAMKKILFLYWAAGGANYRMLTDPLKSPFIRAKLEALIDFVFYPLLLSDRLDCQRSGATFVWLVVKNCKNPHANPN